MAPIINVKKLCFFIPIFLLLLIWLQSCGASIRNWEITPKEAISYLQTSNGVLYTLTADGNVLETEKNGKTKLLPKIDDCRVISIELFDGSLYAGTVGGGIFKRIKIAENETKWSQDGLGGQTVLSLCSHGGYLYVGTDSGGVYKIKSGEEVWELDETIKLPDTRIQALVSRGHDLYAGTSNRGIFKTQVGTDNWKSIAPELKDKNVLLLYACPAKEQIEKENLFFNKSIGSCNDVLYAVTSNSKLYKIDTSNALFPLSSFGENNKSITALTSKDGYLYVGTKDGEFFVTEDGGNTWTLFNAELKNHSIFSATPYGCHLYAGTNNGAFGLALPGCYGYEKVMSRLMTSFSDGKGAFLPALPLINKPTAIVANIEPEKQAAILIDGTKTVYLFVFLTDDLNKSELPLDVVITLAGSNRLPVEMKTTAYPLLGVVGANNVYITWLENTETQTSNYTNYTITTLEGNKLVDGVLPRCTAEFDKEQLLNIRHPGLHDIKLEEFNDAKNLQSQSIFASHDDTTKFKLKNSCYRAINNICNINITYTDENDNLGKDIIYMPPLCENEEALLADDQHSKQFKQNSWPYIYGVTATGTAGVIALLYHCVSIKHMFMFQKKAYKID